MILSRWFVVATSVVLALYQVSILVYLSSREQQSYRVLTAVDEGGGRSLPQIRLVGDQNRKHKNHHSRGDDTFADTPPTTRVRTSTKAVQKTTNDEDKNKNHHSEKDPQSDSNIQSKKDSDTHLTQTTKKTDKKTDMASSSSPSSSEPPKEDTQPKKQRQRKPAQGSSQKQRPSQRQTTPTNVNGNGVKALSYSLWGNTTRYTQGMIHVAQTVRETFGDDWQVWIYHDHTVPKRVLKSLANMAHVRLLNVQTTTIQDKNNNNTTSTTSMDVFEPWIHTDLNPMTWRFLIASNPWVDVYAIRDSDALPSHREYAAVQEFLQSGRAFHVLRDHPAHHPTAFAPILGGMWGGLHRAVPHMKDLLYRTYSLSRRTKKHNHQKVQKDKHQYGNDQDFLKTHILPLAYQDCLQHDSYFCRESHAIAFPLAREDSELDMRREFLYVGNTMASKATGAGQLRVKGGVMAQKEWKARYQQCLNDRQNLQDAWKKQQHLDEKNDNAQVSFARYINTTFTGMIQG